MCGRTCLTLEPREVQCCCKYQNATQTKPKTPEYRNEFNCGRKYQPSHNIAPTDITPVLVSAAHFDEAKDSSERIIVPMMWSMVPRWHKGDYRKHGLTTNNCRLESLAMSKLYGPPLAAGHRCVILCEGFYEWQTTAKELKASERPAFYIHMPQNDGVKVEDKSTWELEKAPAINLLKMAGLFDVWEDENGDKLYSYTVITFESNKKFSTIHHRIPAILETDEEVNAWLDFRKVGATRALNMLKPSESIQWYGVSNLVNNSRNKSDQCNKPIEDVKKPIAKATGTPKSKMMQSWLIVKKRNHEEDPTKKENDPTLREPDLKKPKEENSQKD
ncbi:embryonic stem cell-specific 5-hydroxymethylcytosine-binding protein [Aedes aegypti]|uniref:Abasic site processing protein HMCES n=1 Tax=Aedes aegypti TaxID=7159 RepID=A0A1S4EVU6_AEDAE|nr:embryonic stem cell-specific 5-hydroxymethylcytosine-binding protein [Aedes aegypti]